jgi:ABC-2 type transport system permease protein
MLFWKSMPVSDFGILASKMLAGLTLFPALIFAMLIVTGLILYGLTGLAVSVLPALAVPAVPEIVGSSLQIGLAALVYTGLAMLWYAPLFAWVGMLSTAVGRWSIPLAFLIPGIAVVIENIFVRGMPEIIGSFIFATGPRGGYLADYLSYRLHFGVAAETARDAMVTEQSFDAAALIGTLLAGIDWMQLAGGLIAAALMVFVASEYRRRVLAT